MSAPDDDDENQTAGLATHRSEPAPAPDAPVDPDDVDGPEPSRTIETRSALFEVAGEDDLAGRRIEGVDASGVELPEMDLTYTTWRRSSLRGANLAGADFTGAWMRDVDLSGANLTGAIFNGADLSVDENNRPVVFARAILRDTSFSGASLVAADLSRADLGDADFSEANLTMANLREARLQNTVLAGADMRLVDATDARFESTDLTGTNLTAARLIRAELRDVSLDDTITERADFTDAAIHTE